MSVQAVLVDRGCRFIKKLSIKLRDHLQPPRIDSRIFESLSAIETFARAVCASPDIPGIKTDITDFELSLLCEVPTRPAPSLFVQRHIQQLAVEAHTVSFDIRPHHLPTPLDTPSPAAIVLAQSLMFPSATTVEVKDRHPSVWEPDGDAEPPDPLVLDSIPDNAFPAASGLRCHSRKGLAIGRRMVSKMPAVNRIELRDPTEADAVGVLQAVGGERELECFEAKCVTDVGEAGLTWGDMTDQLPIIKRLTIVVEGELQPMVLHASLLCVVYAFLCVQCLRICGIAMPLGSSALRASGRCSRSEASRSSSSSRSPTSTKPSSSWWRSGLMATPLWGWRGGSTSSGGEMRKMRSLSNHSTPDENSTGTVWLSCIACVPLPVVCVGGCIFCLSDRPVNR